MGGSIECVFRPPGGTTLAFSMWRPKMRFGSFGVTGVRPGHGLSCSSLRRAAETDATVAVSLAH